MAERSAAPRSMADYYGHRGVRERMREYCGIGGDPDSGAVFIVGFAGSGAAATWATEGARVAPAAIDQLWARDADIARSLWDRGHLIFFLDLDYQNTDAHAEPFLHPADTFLKLEPTYQATRRLLGRLGLRAQRIMTGRGYHFAARVPLHSLAAHRLTSRAPATPSWFDGVAARLPEGVTASMTQSHARAAMGLGLITEFAAHLILSDARAASPIPVVFNGTVVGPGPLGRECASIDFSHVGDPLDVRHFRSAFSTYQVHRFRPDIFGPVASAMPAFAAVPRNRKSVLAMLKAPRSLDRAVAESDRQRLVIPEASAGILRLIDEYQRSALAGFHRRFYAAPAVDGPIDGRAADAPPCITAPLDRPNDLLLKPEHLQHLVRGLLARGWTAPGIARLVQSKYEEPHDWGDRWDRIDPRTRAEFDVRVFAGLVETGLDTLVDFNCVSAQEKHLCPWEACQYDLRRDQPALRYLTMRSPDIPAAK